MNSESSEEHNPERVRHTVVLTALEQHADKMKVAQALARVGQLPVERVLQRLDALPWTLTRQASVEKARLLIQRLEALGAELTASPPLSGTANEVLAPVSAVPPDLPAPPPVEQSGVTSPAPARIPPVGLDDRLGGRLGDGPRRNEDLSFELLALEGVLQPGFRLKRTESWLLNVAVIPWQVLGGTLRSLGPSLDRSFDLCRMHFWKLVAIAGLPWLVIGLLAAGGAAAIAVGGLAWDSLSRLPIWVPVIAVVTVIPALLLAGVVLLFLPHAASIYAISMLHQGEEILIGQAYRYAMKRLGRFILTEMLLLLVIVGLVMSSGIAAVLVALPLTGLATALDLSLRSPWFIVAITFLTVCVVLFPLAYCVPKLLFIDAVVMIEDVSGVKALKRSWSLLSGRSGRAWYTSYYWVLGMWLLVSIPLYWGIHILFQGPAWLLSYFLTDLKVLATYTAQVLSQVGGFLAQLVVSVTMVVFYYSVRNRREGLDLLLLTHEGESKPAKDG